MLSNNKNNKKYEECRRFWSNLCEIPNYYWWKNSVCVCDSNHRKFDATEKRDIRINPT